MMTFSIFSVVFLAIGIVLYVMSDQIVEIEQRYDKDCVAYKETEKDKIEELKRKDPNDPEVRTCWVDFKDIPEAGIPGPIYVYYQLDNFY